MCIVLNSSNLNKLLPGSLSARRSLKELQSVQSLLTINSILALRSTFHSVISHAVRFFNVDVNAKTRLQLEEFLSACWQA